ncbi:Janus kinase and microtubule-interacting protein 3 [Stylophora pistillata]|uniref:Janus kinase and microtubule-interacting protein 3 n=1 Tax=Stylophora pistillata TaxID=50429 RepID=A0A2B4SP22_STYPI|nr:Janus kinase and microtubule-interacting protein 3 [Stylophora pistillata]
MSKSQSWKDLEPEGEKVTDLRRPGSQPLHTPQATTNEHSFAALNSSSKSGMDDMRRRIVQLNKELEQERTLTKNLRRDKALVVKQVRDEEQRKAIAMQTELKSKLHKEKINELTALKEQIRKEKEKEITQIIRQKDELLRTAQQAWGKEKDELKLKIRNELRGETREDSKREFEKERGRMEQEIADLHRQKRELDETLKLVQDADKRKIEDIRRIHHEHEAELDRFKRNSWQESRQQMAEIRQLLNIIEQLEKKLGLEAGHSMRLRLEKDNLHDMLKKSTTFDTWDRMMSSGKSEQTTLPGIPDSKGNSQELRMLQRKNVELSSLVRKLDEKNQQLATRNAELLAELEKLEKDNREKNRKLERKNTDLAQTNKRLESRNKLLLDEVNSLKKTLTRRKENSVKQRGPANNEDELGELKAQVREQTRTIADLKQSIMEKDRRIELLRGRKKKSKQQPVSHSLQPTDLFPVIDDDALSVNSDLSEASEMGFTNLPEVFGSETGNPNKHFNSNMVNCRLTSSSEDIDSKRIKKLAKELLALERAYALLQAQVSSAVDAERDEMAKQQLQSDLLESQTRIHELERMIDSGQGSGLQQISNLQEDNKALYQKLVAAEQARDKAQSELDKYCEDMRELQDQRDLLEFELEEMSQLSTAGSEDWDSRRSRNGLESFLSPRMLGSGAVVLTLEEVKALLEELGKEKDDVLSPVQQSALKQARVMLESMDEKIHYMEITEMALRDKVRDLDLGYNSESLKSDLDETRSLSVPTCDRETLTDLQWTELDNTEHYREQRIEAMDYLKYARVLTEDTCSMTDLTGEDLFGLESVGSNYPHCFPERDITNGKSDKYFMTDLAWRESGELEKSHRNVHSFTHGKGISERDMDIESRKHEVGIVTDLSLTELALMEIKYLESIENSHEDKSDVVTEKDEVVGFSSVELVETLPEIVHDTFPEDPTCTKDQCEMTELKCDDIAKLNDKCVDYKHGLEELEKRIALFDVEKKEKSCSTELTWNDIGSLQEKCYSYECIIGELEDKISLFEVEKKDKSSFTELSLQDLVDARFSVDTKEAETITGETDFLDNDVLPEIVFETYPGAETKDEGGTTHGVWEEVVDLKNTYRDYRENLEEMKNKLAQFQVEKDDKESITDIAMQDLADLESLYKEHLHDADSDSNSMVSHAEKESRQCMTELTFVELSELEDFYIENAARQEETPPVVEKWEQESMTEITYDHLQYLEEVEELYRQKTNAGADEEVGKEEKYTAIDLIVTDLDHLLEGSYSLLGSSAEKTDKTTSTDLTVPVLELLQQTEKPHQRCSKVDKCVATEVTTGGLQYWEQEEKVHGICLNGREDEKAIADKECQQRYDAEICTDLTMLDLQYLEDTDAAHEECLRGKSKEFDNKKSEVEMLTVETMTHLTVSDLKYDENVETANEVCFAEKHSVETMTDLTLSELNDLEAVKGPRNECTLERNEDFRFVNKESVEVMTDSTASDLNYLEDVGASREECLADKQEELDYRIVDQESVEVMTDLTASDLKYLEDIEVAYDECLADKQEELDLRIVDEESLEVMTDLTASDLKYLEDIEVAYDECLADKQEELDLRIVDKESVEVMTDLTASDLKYLEDIEVAYDECLADKQEELDLRIVDEESLEVMTDLTASDLKYLEDIEVAHEECLADIHDEPEAATAKKENAEVMTDLSVLDLQRLEDVDASHMQCLFYKDSRKDRNDPPERTSVETMTDMNFQGMLESASAEKEKRKEPKWRRRLRSTSVPVNMQSKHTMTEMTANILEYFEDIEILYKKTLVEYDDFRKSHSVEKVDKDSMTVTTDEDLKYSKDESSTRQETEEKKVMTELAIDDLDYLMGVKSPSKNNELDRSSEEMNSTRGVETVTSVALVSMECMEDEYERPQQEQPQEKDLSWVVIEKENTLPELQYLDEVELSCQEYPSGAAGIVRSRDAEVMTDLTTAYLEYLEEAENLLRSINDNGSQLSGILAPKEDKEVMTELTKSDTDHLCTVGDICTDDTKALSNDNEVEKDDKSTETELTIADIRDLEDQAESASEKRATPSFHEFVPENCHAETLMDLQSELDYLPVLDEPDFIMNEDEDVDIEESQSRDACVMTELTFSDLQHLGVTDACDGVGLTHSRREQTDIGVQCALEDLSSLLEELSRKAEEKGADVPSWFVTALRMRQPGVFNPIHLVVRQTNEIDTSLTVDRPNLGATLEHALERTQMSNIPIDMPHLSECSHGCFLSNDETNLLPSGASAASLKNIGVQCDLVDVDAMLAEFRRIHPHDVDMPLFVSAMNMAREDTGFNPVEVVLRNRSDSNPVQNKVATEPNNSFKVELSRTPPPEKATFTTSSPLPAQCAEEEHSEFPEANNPLLSSQNESDSVLNRTDEATDPIPDGEGRDVLTDMPRDDSAVNRFNKFLKERKDSELRNLMALRQGIDDRYLQDTGDIKSLKELEIENDLLRKQLLILENAKGTEDLEEENRHLWEKLKEKTEELEKESTLLKEKVQSLEDIEEENALIKEKMKVVEADVKNTEKENDELREKVKVLKEASLISDAEVKKTKEENEELKENIKTLEQTMETEKLEREIDYLKQQAVMLSAEPERVKELEEENEILNEKIKALEPSADDVVCENTLLKEQIKELEQNDKLQELKDENNMLKDKRQSLEDASNIEYGRNQDPSPEKQFKITDETGKREKELEDENEVLQEKVQILEESLSSERLENVQLMEKIQDLEHSTGRVVEKLEEENSVLKENIQILEDTTSNMKTLEDENTLLREKIESLYSTKTKDLSKEDFETLQKKIEQLKEAEKTIAALNESNTALKARIDILQSERKINKEVSSDPSEQLGKVRLLLVQDFGLTTSEVESVLGSCDLEGHVSSGRATPRDELNNLGRYFEQELENLKQENRRLCEELRELRRTVEDRQNTERLNEETQTDYAESSVDKAVRSFENSRYVPSSIPGSIEETIAPQVRSTVATEIRYLGDSRLEFEPSPQSRYRECTAFSGKDDPVDYLALINDFENTMPSHNESTFDSDDLISEPELTVSHRNLDNQMDIIDQRIQDLRYRGEKDSVLTEDTSGDRQGFGDLVIFNSDDEGDLPPLPESSPPPLPSELPPDFTESSPPVHYGLEPLLNSDSSPPRDAATLRASSRQRLYSENKPSSEVSQPSSRMESPVLVEETTLVLESDPSELGGIYPREEPTPLAVSSGRRPTGLESIKLDDSKTRVPRQVLPRPKRLLLQKREPAPLNQPVVSFANSNLASSMPSQWLRDEEDGVIPPRGIVLNRAASINRGEIDALNEKIGFLERQLKNKENAIRSLKLERKGRELRILDEDVAFLKEENQKKEKELLTKVGEINKKNYEIEQWKAEASNSERQRQRMEAAYMNLQNQLKSLHGAERELAELQTKYSGMEKQNFELSEKVKKLEKSEKEFKKLEHSIQILQAQLQEMDIVEQDRNNLIEKMKAVENQRDDLLRKGRMVETERNDFQRNNKLMEMQRDDLNRRCSVLQKTNTTLNTRLAQLEHDVREAHTKMHDCQHERNFLKVQLEKMEAERNEMQTRLALTTQERNSLENQVAELYDLNRDHVKLEDSFHSLRIQLAESMRQKDDTEMQIPTLKAKISLLRIACKEKDDLVEKLNAEIRDLRHFISTSTLDDLSKIRSFGYAQDNFKELPTHRDREKQIAKQVPKLFEASPPGAKKAKRFIALCDYDPRNSPSSEHPELELILKEGDLLTVFGDMDINGYFEADVNGERGLVPSLYVEEVEDKNDSDLALEEQLRISHRRALKHGALNRSKEVQLHPDIFSCRRGNSSSGASSTGLEKPHCLVAVHDYDPFCSGVPGLPPHDQLPLKKGDIMTTLEDQDANGFYRVFLKGQTGFVPGEMVEKESFSLLRQPVNSKAPEQILGMLHNNPGQGQPEATASDHATPLSSMGSVMSLTHEGNPNGPQLSLNHTRLPGSPNKLPSVGLTKFKPSPDVDILGVMASVTQSSQQLVPLSSRKPAKISSAPAASKQIVPFVSTKSRSKKVRPSAPSNFRIIRPVNHDAMLLGWTLPEMDEFGRSSGLSVKGYKISANDDVRLDVHSPYMAKALVEGLELGLPIKFSIKTVAENGASSETVTATFDDIIKESLLDSREEYFEFVALYDYDPFKSSPNQNPAAEMSFKEGDILQVFNTLRKDGYFVGKLKNKKGLIPSNFVEEIAVASPLRLAAAKRRKAALPSPTRLQSVGINGSPTVGAKNPVEVNKKIMVALYDYNPERQSPQDSPDSELPLRKGQIFAVLGDMNPHVLLQRVLADTYDKKRADGFYHAEINGERGLVPGSFLNKFTTGGTGSGLECGIPKPVEWSGSQSVAIGHSPP